MATTKVIVSVLDVGQGQGTFVEVYNGNKLTNTLLFDLGSSSGSRTAGASSIEYISEKVTGMTKPKIDYLSLSHKDKDHVNLILKLIAHIEDNLPVGKMLSIGMVRYGGAKSWYKTDLMSELKDLGANINSLNLNHKAFTKTGGTVTWKSVWSENDVSVYIMLANTPTPESTAVDMMELEDENKDPDKELANCVSIVCSVWWNNNQFFINGDATFVTFQEFIKTYKFLTQFDQVKMVTLPHHGSRNTTFGLNVSTEDASKESTKVVNTFAKKIKANTVTGSAAVHSVYHHPSYDVIDLFSQHTQNTPRWDDPQLAGGNRHYATAFLDQDFYQGTKNQNGFTRIYKSYETSASVYTTLYCVPGYIGNFLAPPTNPVKGGTAFPLGRPVFALGYTWVYTVIADGTITLAPEVNRPGTVTMASMKKEAPSNIQTRSRQTALTDPFSVKPPASAKRPLLKNLKLFR